MVSYRVGTEKSGDFPVPFFTGTGNLKALHSTGTVISNYNLIKFISRSFACNEHSITNIPQTVRGFNVRRYG